MYCLFVKFMWYDVYCMWCIVYRTYVNTCTYIYMCIYIYEPTLSAGASPFSYTHLNINIFIQLQLWKHSLVIVIQPGKHGKLTWHWKNSHLKKKLLLKMVNVPLLCQFFGGTHSSNQPVVTSSASPTPCGNRSSISPSSVAPARPPKIKLQHFCANEIFQGGNLELSRKTRNTTTQEPITPPNGVSTWLVLCWLLGHWNIQFQHIMNGVEVIFQQTWRLWNQNFRTWQTTFPVTFSSKHSYFTRDSFLESGVILPKYGKKNNHSFVPSGVVVVVVVVSSW